MCTVSYLPEDNNGFILTSNRDESVNRSANLPEFHSYQDQVLLFPKDALTPGTWIVCSSDVSVCLLNGGYEAHEHNPPYKKSRGLVCLDLALMPESLDFISYDLNEIEPFTALHINHSSRKLVEFVWDGKALNHRILDSNLPYIWSSSTLYSSEWRSKRKEWFLNFLLQKPKPNPQEVFDFHHYGGNSDAENGFIMSRKNGILKTISLTQITFSGKPMMKHVDLLTEQEKVLSFKHV